MARYKIGNMYRKSYFAYIYPMIGMPRSWVSFYVNLSKAIKAKRHLIQIDKQNRKRGK